MQTNEYNHDNTITNKNKIKKTKHKDGREIG
jgi:hypothetical protein